MIGAFEQASCLASDGFAVFPVNLDKSPRTPNGHKAASTDPERIKAMATQYGFALIGVATGAESNLAVLDIDKQHGGAAWFADNRHRLAETRTHRTRSGGLHLWFRHKPGLRCSAGRIAPGIDVRAEGGYVIYWPAAGLAMLRGGPLAPWPTWLAPPPKTPPTPAHATPWVPPAAHIEAQLAGLIRTIAAAPRGRRNASLFWAACRAAEIIAQGQLSKSHAEAAMIEAAGRVALNHQEAARTIASALAGRAA